MYPEATAADDACPTCHLRRQACLCRAWQSLPSLTSGASFFLLVHPRELHKPTNTGHILLAAQPATQYAVWSRTDIDSTLQDMLTSSAYQPYLLYPEPAAQQQPLTPAEVKAQAVVSGRQPLYLLLDGTWQEARKMLRQSPFLQDLPRVALSPNDSSRYSLRRNQHRQGLATVEVAVALLAALGESASASALQAHFQVFLEHYEASRSNHTVSGGGRRV